MFEYLIGYVTAVNSRDLVLDVNGVGYAILVADPSQFHPDRHQKIKIYVYQVVTDTSQTLYGFRDRSTKTIFEQLIKVSGIGPKNAVVISSSGDQRSLLNAIETEDFTYLTKFPGVGKKTAKQIVLDLKDKLGNLKISHVNEPKASGPLKDALSALVSLGYSNQSVRSITSQLTQHRDFNTNQYLSLGLKLLNRFRN